MPKTQPKFWFLDLECPKCEKHSLTTDGVDVWCSRGEAVCDYYWPDSLHAIKIAEIMKDLNED